MKRTVCVFGLAIAALRLAAAVYDGSQSNNIVAASVAGIASAARATLSFRVHFADARRIRCQVCYNTRIQNLQREQP